MNPTDNLRAIARVIDARIDALLAEYRAHTLIDAMAHSLAGGKRVRGSLVMEGAAIHGLEGVGPERAAVAIECLHAYSMIHDDMPCMDDDEMRRGAPTVHVKWDEATAILSGDALQAMAFEILADVPTSPDPAIRARLVHGLALASGAAGMVRGQADDIAAEQRSEPFTLDQIAALQRDKTGRLLIWSCEAGALLADADPAPLRRYGAAIGTAFQIADDLLDVTGDQERVGKKLRKDSGASKATFVSLLGEQGARRRAEELAGEACAAIAHFGKRADMLRDMAWFIVRRDH